MESDVLEGIVEELRVSLIGCPVFRVAAVSDESVVLLFDDAARSRLFISASPGLARLHLSHRHAPRRESSVGGFLALAGHHLKGAILRSIEKQPDDRVVRFRFEGPSGPGESLVVELLGRSPNLLLLDPEDRVLGSLRRPKSEIRRPIPGETYRPPRPRLGTVSGEGPSAAAGSGHVGSGPGPGRREQSARDAGGTAESGTEHGATEPGSEAQGRTPAYIYSAVPPEALDVRTAPPHDRFLLSRRPLTSLAHDLVCHEFASLNAAAEVYYDALAAGVAFRTRRDALLAIARREARRAGEIAAKVGRDLQGMQDAGRYRRYGEALLAGLAQASRQGELAVVADPYDSEGGSLAIPIDPAKTLPANAERYFQKFRKAERGKAVAAERRATQAARSESLSALAEAIDRAVDESDLAAGEASLRQLGIAVALERRRHKAAGPAAPIAEGVRIFTSSEGYEILVGKGSEENDRLTFKIASPEDVWLHASGAAGAHVIVRNPRNEPRLPRSTLREAAELAAYFSKAKASGRAEVLVTRRKFVRRVRGAARGVVTVKKHESLSVAPRNPFEKP